MSYSLSFSQALFIALYIADKVATGIFDFTPTQKISEDLGFPSSSTSVILRKLNRGRIVETREGVKGGVRLARTPTEVTVLDIFTAIEQDRPLFQTNIQPAVSGEKPAQAQQSIVTVLQNSESAMKESLQSVTVQDLLDAINL